MLNCYTIFYSWGEVLNLPHPRYVWFVVRFYIDPPLLAIIKEMAQRGGDMFGKRILVTIGLLLSVPALHTGMERGVCNNVVQFRIVGVRYPNYKIPFSLSSSSESPTDF